MTASKTKRLLYFMSELEKGNDISKTDYLARFGISERTLKQDVSELKENLIELRPNMKAKYSRKNGSYHAQYEQGYGNLKYNQAVILSKILLESRALRKDEEAQIKKGIQLTESRMLHGWHWRSFVTSSIYRLILKQYRPLCRIWIILLIRKRLFYRCMIRLVTVMH